MGSRERVECTQTLSLPWEVEKLFLTDLRLKDKHMKEDQKGNKKSEENHGKTFLKNNSKCNKIV